MKITTSYTLTQNKVSGVSLSDGSQICSASLSEDGENYTYQTFLDGDRNPRTAPKPMSLADCILAAHVHLGVIPPQNFDPIPCRNQH